MTEFFHRLTATWWGITLIVLAGVALLTLFSAVFYRQFFKRFYDILLSFVAIVILSPVMLILIIAGAIAMGGNPFFTQKRPGKKRRNGEEKIFRLIKFRTMSNKRDENGNLLPDEKRLNKYGRILRSTSLDELPELFNIFIGDMSVVGPRPLLVEYLPRYSEEQRRRHCVRPGLTGYAQVNGRNALSWEKRFELDVYYVDHVSLFFDIKILFATVKAVFRREGISSGTSATMEIFYGTEEKNKPIGTEPNAQDGENVNSANGTNSGKDAGTEVRQ